MAKLLSNAYAGKAGLDTFNLLETIDSLSEEEGGTGSIDMVGKVLGGDDATLTNTEIDQKIGDLNKAIESLNRIETLNDEQKVQLGLLSLNRAALTIAAIISKDTSQQSITLTEKGISDRYPNKDADFSDININTELTTLSTDITNVANSIDAILSITGQAEGKENDLANNFDEFSNAVDTNGNGDITTTELQNYINTIGS